jgi:hypothetical protein
LRLYDVLDATLMAFIPRAPFYFIILIQQVTTNPYVWGEKIRLFLLNSGVFEPLLVDLSAIDQDLAVDDA